MIKNSRVKKLVILYFFFKMAKTGPSRHLKKIIGFQVIIIQPLVVILRVLKKILYFLENYRILTQILKKILYMIYLTQYECARYCCLSSVL